MLLQAATATVTAPPTPSITMAVIGVTTGVLALGLAIVGAVVYAYRMGGFSREMQATKDAAVTATSTLAGTVEAGFKSVHRRMDEAELERREQRQTNEERREELTRWRGTTDQRLARAIDLARRASRRAHASATLTQGAITQLAVLENELGIKHERRTGVPERRGEPNAT